MAVSLNKKRGVHKTNFIGLKFNIALQKWRGKEPRQTRKDYTSSKSSFFDIQTPQSRNKSDLVCSLFTFEYSLWVVILFLYTFFLLLTLFVLIYLVCEKVLKEKRFLDRAKFWFVGFSVRWKREFTSLMGWI